MTKSSGTVAKIKKVVPVAQIKPVKPVPMKEGRRRKRAYRKRMA